MRSSVRSPEEKDIPSLQLIWRTAFGDGDIAAFFSHYYEPNLCAAVYSGSVPVAAGYLLPAGRLITGQTVEPCAMIYAVATLPGYRSRGFAAAITNELLAIGREAGFTAVALCPSEDSLFGYYSSRTDLRDWFYISERKIFGAPAFRVNPALNRVEAAEYLCLRESLLTNTAHIEPDLRALNYQTLLSSEFGGGFFHIDEPGAASCAAIEIDKSGTVWIRELLSPDGYYDNAVRAVTAAFAAPEYVVRTPARIIQPGADDTENYSGVTRRFGMLSAGELPVKRTDGVSMAGFGAMSQMPWLGFAFD